MSEAGIDHIDDIVADDGNLISWVCLIVKFLNG